MRELQLLPSTWGALPHAITIVVGVVLFIVQCGVVALFTARYMLSFTTLPLTHAPWNQLNISARFALHVEKVLNIFSASAETWMGSLIHSHPVRRPRLLHRKLPLLPIMATTMKPMKMMKRKWMVTDMYHHMHPDTHCQC